MIRPRAHHVFAIAPAIPVLLSLLVALVPAVLPRTVQAGEGAAAAAAAAAEPGGAEPAPSPPTVVEAGEPVAAHAQLVATIERALADGAYGPGLDACARALALAEAIGDPVRLGVSYGLRARLLGATGELDAARADFARAQKALAGAPALADANRLNRANLEASLGRYDEAERAYQGVAKSAEARGDAALRARALANAWRARVEADPRAPSRSAFDAAGAARAAVDDPGLRASLALRLAQGLFLARTAGAARDRDWLLASHALLAGALADVDAARSPVLRAEVLGQLGALYESEARFEEAAALTDRALAQARRGEGPIAGARWPLQAGRLRRRLGELETALAHYTEAVEIVGRPGEAAVAARPGRAGASDVESEDAQAYRGLVDLLLLRAASQSDAAKRTADLREAQSVLETYRVAELRDYFADECVDRDRASRSRVDEAPGRFVVLYPVILDDRLELIVSRRDWIESRRVPIARADLEKLARQYRGLLEDRTTRLYLRPAQALHAVLIAPIRDLLDKEAPDTLVVVPDGILRTIPFAALHDGERHLIERVALATTPSLELSDPHPFVRTGIGSLYGGLTTAVQGFDALPQVKQELETANRYLPGTILLDDSFSRETLTRELSTRSFDLVHVASHAEFSSAEKGGFLLTHDGKLPLGEFRKAVELLQYRERPLELLVLSACETAAGDERAALGFSGAAVQAGARSVLGSLWLVQDEATSVLLAAFYEALADPSVSRAQAMQRAQLRLIGDPAYAHPSAWAAFLLINSWL